MKDILNYQEIDVKLRGLQEQISQNEDRQNALKLQAFLKDSQAKLVALSEKSAKLNKDFVAYKKVYDKMIGNLDVVNKNLNTQDESKLDSLIEANETIYENLSKLETEISNIVKFCESIKNDYNNIMKNARNARTNMEKHKAAFQAFKTQKDAEIAELEKELAAAGTTVDKTLLAKYKSKSVDKMPVFVPLVSGRCGRCRMEVSAVGQNKLKNAKFIECENCGRLIYLK